MTEPTRHELIAEASETGTRLDLWLVARLPELSRAAAQRLVRDGLCRVDGASVRSSHKLRAGQRVTVEIVRAQPWHLEPEEIPLRIIHEDADIIAIDKPAGMVVHPGAGVKRGTLAASLLHHLPDLEGVGGVERPGIVHRLDRGTSGVIVVAKNDRALRSLQAQFQARSVKKTYIALVWGRPRIATGSVDAAIGRSRAHGKMSTRGRKGRQAVTRYEITETFGSVCTLLSVRPLTGRTHQIRVHMASIGHPIVGDPMYGRGGRRAAPAELLELPRPALHAFRLEITHPATDCRIVLQAELPADLVNLIGRLRKLSADSSTRSGSPRPCR